MKPLLATLLLFTGSLPVRAQAPPVVVEYYHVDALGSVRAVTNQAGSVVARHDYAPFGEELPAPTGDDTLRFAGKERDTETGLNYFGARYYGNWRGRFTTVDPVLEIEHAVAEPQLWNRYTYVTNNPLRYTDPTGRERAGMLLDQDVRDLVAGRITRDEYNARINARGVGAFAGAIILGGPIVWRAAVGCFFSPSCQSVAIDLLEGAAGGAPTSSPTIQLESKAAARAALAELGDVGVAANRFFRDATSKSTGFRITDLANRLRRLEFFSPANNPGYGKRYVQEIDEFGRILREYKETIGPNGVIETKWVHGGPGQ